MSVEDKFYAAVNVIRSLPKNGSYQPSHDLMLRFYGYYKQATEGPNRSSKPAFWEVVKKAKWDAWNRLGNMSKHEAMLSYVQELNKIVETMAYTDNVADFLSSLDSFYGRVGADDLEMCIGPALSKVRSQPASPLSNTPLGSRESSPIREERRESPSPVLPSEDEEEYQDFIDTLEQTEDERKEVFKKQEAVLQFANPTTDGFLPNGKIDIIENAIERAVENLRTDIVHINERLRKLEERYKTMWKKRRMVDLLPGNVVVWLVVWPLILQLIIHLWARTRR